MMELNREQIVKALECCSTYTGIEDCEKCPLFNNGCQPNQLEGHALALIRELTEENERLRDNLERTEKALIALDKAHNALFTDTFRIEAETVRKMQEMLKECFCCDSENIRNTDGYVRDVVDQIAKKLLEDLNNG